MSIPPLVCCTPPPPDQCEEDKDPEDFDISYNLSQDDDNDVYEYGNFSAYNQDQKRINEIDVEVSPSCESKHSFELGHDDHYQKDQNRDIISPPEEQIIIKKDTDCQEFELDIKEESVDSCNRVESEPVISLSLDSSISDNNVERDVGDLRTLSPSPEVNINSVESAETEEIPPLDDQVAIETYNEVDVASQRRASIETISFNKALENVDEKSSTLIVDDDFGDFDDFQFTTTDDKASPIVDNTDNPWDGPSLNENDDFGEFTAHFEASDLNSENTLDILPENQIPQQAQQESHILNAIDDTVDDFGDFDDFQSSAVEQGKDVENTASNDQPYINLQLPHNESQLMESISSVLSSVFEEDISETEIDIEGKLESMLSGTWGHLRETDVRQPYIVNWNNSNGQNTLLRALCIDSRNILFGPKWGYNMPKYAVNLSNAPLQPQKPLTPANSSQTEATSIEKTSNKPGSWVDPFASDGQESCNAESESVVEVTTSDLDVFEAVISSKPDKIYASTLNVQPLRQINLPDTHIFTPTDSETPRSKTIHYDNVPPIILPQPSVENNQPVGNFNTPTFKQKHDDDEDWEFQEFKGMSGGMADIPPEPKETIQQSHENVSKASNVYQIQVLEPIKMEPIMPSLNWPDPGEVKETFEDFSDFISKSAWEKDEPNKISPKVSKSTPEPIVEKLEAKFADLGTETKIVTPTVSRVLKSVNVDDDFDTFQSALPSNNAVSGVGFTSVSSDTVSNIPTMNQSPSIVKDFQYTFPKIYKSDSISFENTIRPNEALTQSLGYNPILELTPNTNMSPIANTISPSLLQPQPFNTTTASQKTQNSTQILQPLSLESYSQINWPNPGLDLQDLSRFNPVETLQSLKSDLSSASGSGGSSSKGASPVHAQKITSGSNQVSDEDIWGEFVSSKPKQSAIPKKAPVFADDDEWTDFVSSSSVKPQNGLNTISFNVHTNSNIQKNINNSKFISKNNKAPLDIPTLNYITPKSSGHSNYNERHFQNL